MVNLLSLEDVVPLPIFSGKISEADRRAEVMTSYRAHWAGQIALRRLCANIHQNINGSMSSEPTPDSGEDFNGPAASTLATLASQLDQWRNMLPWPVRWPDGDPCANPPLNEHIPLVGRTADSYQSTQYGGQHYQRPFFTKDLGAEVAQYPYVYNMQVALLRTRYLYARYMIYRPFIYKALHFPDQITQDDALGVAECLKVRASPLPQYSN